MPTKVFKKPIITSYRFVRIKATQRKQILKKINNNHKVPAGNISGN